MNAAAAQALTSSARLARMRPRSVRGPPSDQARRSSQRAQRWKSGGKARKPSRLDFQARSTSASRSSTHRAYHALECPELMNPAVRGIGAGHRTACGWLIDRFGLRWQIVPAILDELMRDKDPARSKRVTDALLRMVKLDIAALEKAYRGS